MGGSIPQITVSYKLLCSINVNGVFCRNLMHMQTIEQVFVWWSCIPGDLDIHNQTSYLKRLGRLLNILRQAHQNTLC